VASYSSTFECMQLLFAGSTKKQILCEKFAYFTRIGRFYLEKILDISRQGF
jgi:hypothetical protein